eukprot:gnl/Hemi2/17015_TR5651_c0_g1_i1.p1 gnl/Hemi2/17015_TR5651_c0_g1~~gnl/Hemi2/17015_TR5651_c0_g1_i1.p1  ORF type:complete len:461 (-),score=142.41 gnl/Hemi2/17015_TR5651_c0_g1_i1:167-1549(-)
MVKDQSVVVVVLLACVASVALGQQQYTPTWDSLDARPLPGWFDEAKIGLFIHWGVYSVPSFACPVDGSAEWYWWSLDGAKSDCANAYHNNTYGPHFKYQDFANSFHADLFDPAAWAALFAKAGIKYVVLTSKHHEGFTNWPSAESWNWNSVDIGPHRDLLGDLAAEVRKAGMRMGCYHSLFEWFNPLYLQDKANNFTTSVYVDSILQPQLRDLMTNYQCDVIWSDGDWEAPDTYWKSKEFLAWAYNNAPNKDSFITNDRWGAGDSLKHGGYYSGDDRYNPGVLLQHKWESAFTIDGTTWGYNRASNLSNYLSPEQLISNVVSAVACNGNVLINVGPMADGTIAPVFQERLLQLGSWLSVNGEAIYGTMPWRAQNETKIGVWYTAKNFTVYAIATQWPANNQLVLTIPKATPTVKASLLGYAGALNVTTTQEGLLVVSIPAISPNDIPCQWAWVFRLDGVM